MLIRARQSRLLPPEEIEKMQSSGSGCIVHDRDGGHLTLMNLDEEQNAISRFLQS